MGILLSGGKLGKGRVLASFTNVSGQWYNRNERRNSMAKANEFKAAEKMNKGNEQSFYDSLSTLEEKLGHPKYMIFLSNALRGYKVDMYGNPLLSSS